MNKSVLISIVDKAFLGLKTFNGEFVEVFFLICYKQKVILVQKILYNIVWRSHLWNDAMHIFSFLSRWAL